MIQQFADNAVAHKSAAALDGGSSGGFAIERHRAAINLDIAC